jgi:hypothetical protein
VHKKLHIYVLQPTAIRFHVLKLLNNQLIIYIVEQITFDINIDYMGKILTNGPIFFLKTYYILPLSQTIRTSLTTVRMSTHNFDQ